jgi:hypothetical protein
VEAKESRSQTTSKINPTSLLGLCRTDAAGPQDEDFTQASHRLAGHHHILGDRFVYNGMPACSGPVERLQIRQGSILSKLLYNANLSRRSSAWETDATWFPTTPKVCRKLLSARPLCALQIRLAFPPTDDWLARVEIARLDSATILRSRDDSHVYP